MHYNDKVINVVKTGVDGIHFFRNLYADTAFYEDNPATYYTEEGDGSDSLVKIGFFDNFEKAECEFKEYLKDMEIEYSRSEIEEKIGDVWDDLVEMQSDLECLLPAEVYFGEKNLVPFSDTWSMEIYNDNISFMLSYEKVDEGVKLIGVE